MFKLTIKSIFILSIFVVSIILLALLQSCNEKPTTVGYEFVLDTIEVYPLTSNEVPLITSHKSYRRHIPIFNSGAMLLGQVKDNEGVSTAYMILRFSNFPDSNHKIISITGAVLYLYPLRYGFGDTISNMLSFDVHPLTKIVTQETDCDSLDDTYYDGNTILARWEGKIEYLDSIPRISMEFDTNIVRQWLIEQSEPNRDTLMNGIFIKPNPNSTIIRQFSAASISAPKRDRPMLKVYYTRADGKPDSSITRSANDISIVCTPKINENQVVVQGASGYRTEFEFDVSILPPLSAIHRADFELIMNESKSKYGNFGPDSLLRLEFIVDSTDEDYFTRLYEGVREKNSQKYVFNYLASAVEIWNRRGGKGRLILRPANVAEEQQQMDRIYFFGLEDLANKPKLRIIYSKRPALRCD